MNSHFTFRHERQLHFVFSKMDSNKSGRVTSTEIKNAFNNLGINIGAEEAEKLVARIDDDNSLDISFEEIRALRSPIELASGLLVNYWGSSVNDV